jgi:hypothetical protein
MRPNWTPPDDLLDALSDLLAEGGRQEGAPRSQDVG